MRIGDKISNFTAIGKDPLADWLIGRQREWGRDVVAGLRGASAELEAQFDRAADEADRLIYARRAG